jgi:hypothetical protein
VVSVSSKGRDFDRLEDVETTKGAVNGKWDLREINNEERSDFKWKEEQDVGRNERGCLGSRRWRIS